MVKIKSPEGIVDIAECKLKSTQGLCDKCSKRIKYKYIQVDDKLAIWIVKCSCGYLNVCEV